MCRVRHDRHWRYLELPKTQYTLFTAICNTRLRILCDIYLHTVLLCIIYTYNTVLEYQRAPLSHSRKIEEHTLSSWTIRKSQPYLSSHLRSNNRPTPTKQLEDSTVTPARHLWTHRHTLENNYVHSVEMNLTTAHQLGRNGTSSNRDSENRDSRVYCNRTLLRKGGLNVAKGIDS
jgi:hypothetical protein